MLNANDRANPNRREFLRTLGVTIASAPTVSDALLTWTPQRQLGVALVGLGSLSTNQIAPALQKTKHCKLAAIVTGTPEKATRWKAQYSLPDNCVYNYDTMRALAQNPAVDIVYVVTPNALHAEHTIKAAEAGKHVLCEKPMEVSIVKSEAMIAACKRAGRQLAIAYRCRFEPHHLECERLAKSKVFGDTRIIRAEFGFQAGNPTQWRLNKALAGGGPLMDVGIYALQTARMMTGEEPTSVTAVAATTDTTKFKDIEESITFQLTFPSGVIANCAATYKVNGLNGFTVFCDRGSFGMLPAYNYGGNRGFRSDNQPLVFDPVDQFATELDDFARCIIENRPTTVSGDEGLRDMRILMAIYDSAKFGRAVKLGV